jgi:hypothetical protein
MRIANCASRLALALMTVGPLVSALSAQVGTVPSNAAYEEKIRSLEARVASLEKALARLITDREGAPAVEPEPVPAPAQTPPPPVRSASRFEMPPELVPDIGKIGAQVGLLLGGSNSPFRLNNGSFTAGFIDLPLFDRPNWLHGKVSYEILVGMSQSRTTFETTSNVAQVANLAVLNTLNPNGGLQNVVNAVTGSGPAPFPVKTSNLTRLRLLQVVPFALKYTNTSLERWRLRPYGVIGFGTFVTIHHQNPGRGTPPTYGVRKDADLPPEILAAVNQIFGGQAPFGGPLVAGQISQAPELEARGLPGGHGNIDLGLHSAVGAEFRISRTLSLGFDARFNKIAGTFGGFKTFGSRIGVHF